MKALVLILICLLSNSCDPLKETAEESTVTSIGSIDNKGSTNTPPIQESTNPGEVTLKLKVVEVYDSGKDICGTSRTNVMKMSVQEVLTRGSSIVNMPNKTDVILMNFILVPKDLSTDSYIEAKASESLCKDASKTYFTIISYEIVE